MSKQRLDSKQIQEKLLEGLARFSKYNFILFIVLVAVLYGFILMKIQTLKNAQPSSDTISAQVSAAKVPKINEALVRQLQTLHDNSVSVQTLFDSTRSNPFKE